MAGSGRGGPATAVYLEIGAKRVFACSFDWPGWCRSGRNEKQALEALAAAGARYAPVAAEAGLSFVPGTAPAFEVLDRIRGSATTDFGAPGAVAPRDHEPLTSNEAGRLAALVRASWTIFDGVAASASAELRKGPRGGGRDRDAIVEHVLAAESSYARTLGIRLRPPTLTDAVAIRALRDAIGEALSAAAETPLVTGKGWPPRYAARRIAWHVLDHAWEIEDRSTPAT